MYSLLCRIGIHSMYWLAYTDENGYLFDGYRCKHCHKEYQHPNIPRSHRLWLALKNLAHASRNLVKAFSS